MDLSIIGKKFNKLLVLSFSHMERKATNLNAKSKYNYYYYFNCLCDCGVIKKITRSDLNTGRLVSCGCVNKHHRVATNIKDMSGSRIGRLLVLYNIKNKGKPLVWLCKCECGNEKIISGSLLRRGESKSCGCLRKETLNKNREGFLKNKVRVIGETRKRIDAKWRKIILDKFENKCIICDNTYKLEAHHLESFKKSKELRVHENNGVALCYNCHKKFHSVCGRYGNRAAFRNFYEYCSLNKDEKMNYKTVVALDFFDVIYKAPENENDLYNLSSENIINGSLDYTKKLVNKNIDVVVWADQDAFLKDKVSFIKNWMDENGFPKEIKVTTILPRYNYYISSNAFRFRGDFEEVKKFMSDETNLKSWYKK